MEKMKKTAKNLDVFCRVLQILCSIAAVAAVVSVLIIAAFFVFGIPAEQIGTGYNSLDLGYLELELADGAVPELSGIFWIAGVNLVIGFMTVSLLWLALRYVREILRTMQEGLPFQPTAVTGLRRLAVYTVIWGVLRNAITLVNLWLTDRVYDISGLLTGEKVAGVELHLEVDLSFLMVAAVLLLLSYIFSYGAVLQQQSDETL